MRRSVGLDIGATEVRWVELEEERGRRSVRSSGTVLLSGFGEGAVTEAVRTLAGGRRWRGCEVVVALPRAAAALRWLSLPAAPRDDTAGMVELEIAHALPFSVDEAAWDFIAWPGAEGRQDVLLVAARQEAVERRRRAVESSGVKISALSLDTLAAVALYRAAVPDTEQTALVVHRDGLPTGNTAETATLSTVRADRLELSRSITLEGGSEAEALAMEIRRTLVASLSGLGQWPARTAAVSGEATQISTIDSRSLTIWLTGDGADEPFARELAVALGPEAHAPGEDPELLAVQAPAAARTVRVAPLPREALVGAEALPPSLDGALGLALIGLRPATERVDLARQAMATSETTAPSPARRLPLLVGAGVVAVGAAFLLLGPGDKELAAAAARAQADARQIATRRAEVEGRLHQLTGAVTPAHSYLDVLNDVSRLSGPDAWLTQFTYDRGRPVVIRGAALSNEAVERIVGGLRASPHLDQVTLGSVTREETKEMALVQFTITGLLRGDAPLEKKRTRGSRTPRSGA